jgi:putative ABC transport system permease protein
MASDLRLALRRLRGSPGFTTFAILTLSIGIAATTALHAAAYAALFRPMDIKNIDEVVNLYHSRPPRAGHEITFSWPDVEDIRKSQTVFNDVMAWSRFMQLVTGPAGPQMGTGEMVSGNYFEFVGATSAAIGRTLAAVDESPSGPDVVVLGHAYWQQQFGKDPAVLGRTIRIRGRQFTIVGVMPETFRGVDMPNVKPTNFWIPIREASALRPPGRGQASIWNDREDRWVYLKGRLAHGRSLDGARAQMAAIAARLDQTNPIGGAPHTAGNPQRSRPFFVQRASDVRSHESMDFIAVPAASGLLIAVGLVLLVACTNVANLVLARNARLARDVAVRRALGATRFRLIRERLSESVIVGAAGCVLGLLFASWFMRLLTGSVVGRGMTITLEPRFSTPVVIVTLLSAIASVVIFGLLPAWHGSKGDLRSVTESDTGATVARWRGRRLLIAGQVFVSVSLLVVGATFVRSAVTDPGFALDRLAAAQIEYAFDASAKDPVRLQQALERVRQQPGIEAASLVDRLPIYFSGGSGAWLLFDQPKDLTRLTLGQHMQYSHGMTGTPDMFHTMGIGLLAGRTFTEAEAQAHARVVVMSRQAALKVFDTTSVVGRTVFSGTQPYDIIGVTEDTDGTTFGNRDRGFVYTPFDVNARSPVIVARSTEGPVHAAGRIRAVLSSLNLPVVEVATGPHIIKQDTLLTRVAADISVLLGAFALLLALIGLSGLLAYLVASRRREIGVRMALGAEPRRVVRMILGDGLRPVVVGSVLGLVGGAFLTSAASFLTRQRSLDVTGLIVVPLILLPAAWLACYLPARRAARVDPNVALRQL